MTDGICCKLQAVLSRCTISPSSPYHIPTTTVNKMHSRRGHTTRQCFAQEQPTHPLKLFSIFIFFFVSSFLFFLFLFCSVLPFSLLSFFFFFPPTPSLLSAVEVNHHLYYTALQLINNMPGRKKNNPHLLSSLSLTLSDSLLLSLAKSQNKRAKNSELPRNPIWTPPWRLHGQRSQPALE